MKIQNRFLQPIAVTIFSADVESKETFGLLTESMRLRLRQDLQNIRAELLTLISACKAEIDKVEEEFKDKGDPENLKLKEAKLKEIFDRTVVLKSPPASMADIGEITSSVNYNFALIRMIAR